MAAEASNDSYGDQDYYDESFDEAVDNSSLNGPSSPLEAGRRLEHSANLKQSPEQSAKHNTPSFVKRASSGLKLQPSHSVSPSHASLPDYLLPTSDASLPASMTVDLASLPKRSTAAAATKKAVTALENLALSAAIGLTRQAVIRGNVGRLQPSAVPHAVYLPPRPRLPPSAEGPLHADVGATSIALAGPGSLRRRYGAPFQGPSLLEEETGAADQYESRRQGLRARSHLKASAFEGAETAAEVNLEDAADVAPAGKRSISARLRRQSGGPNDAVRATAPTKGVQQSTALATAEAKRRQEAVRARMATQLLRNKLHEVREMSASMIQEQQQHAEHDNAGEHGHDGGDHSAGDGAESQFIPPPLTAIAQRRDRSAERQRHSERRRSGSRSHSPAWTGRHAADVPTQAAAYDTAASGIGTVSGVHSLRSASPRNRISNGLQAAAALGLLPPHSHLHQQQQRGDYQPEYLQPQAQQAHHLAAGSGFSSQVHAGSYHGHPQQQHFLASGAGSGGGGAVVPVVVPAGPGGKPMTMYLCSQPPPGSPHAAGIASTVAQAYAPGLSAADLLQSSVQAAFRASTSNPSYASSLPPSSATAAAASRTPEVSDDLILQMFLLSTIKGVSSAEKDAESAERRIASAAGLLALPSLIGPHGSAHGITNEQAIRLLRYGGGGSGGAAQSSPAAGGPAAAASSASSASSQLDAHPTPFQLAAGWGPAFDQIFSHVVLNLPRLVAESALACASMQPKKGGDDGSSRNNADRGRSRSPARTTGSTRGRSSSPSSSAAKPLPLPLSLSIASPLLTSLQDMLTDVDVLTLIREAVASKIQARVAAMTQQSVQPQPSTKQLSSSSGAADASNAGGVAEVDSKSQLPASADGGEVRHDDRAADDAA